MNSSLQHRLLNLTLSSFQPLRFFAKSSILDVWWNSEHASVYCKRIIPFLLWENRFSSVFFLPVFSTFPPASFLHPPPPPTHTHPVHGFTGSNLQNNIGVWKEGVKSQFKFWNCSSVIDYLPLYSNQVTEKLLASAKKVQVILADRSVVWEFSYPGRCLDKWKKKYIYG